MSFFQPSGLFISLNGSPLTFALLVKAINSCYPKYDFAPPDSHAFGD